MTYEEMILSLARDRGLRGDTFGTAEELAFDGYNGAWIEGRVTALLDVAQAELCFDGLPGIEINGLAQHRVNLALYALRELRQLLISANVIATPNPTAD
ncbi:MAG: hypothetical protein A2Y61_00340 [Chloroflexi bacterium RBG_13_60_13]|nr:MAG: hypothetical protein A2Y61_00340 [Chloroflexi bacterium RBG_13_60_13]